ncbi:MAG TPA: adenylyltransferase/cytidyltransferase family protein [Bryobacteraceae bacterium]|nr:adenylyltransferase/cytidyltransferase family protein [Bryobacteraceae bacterium]
MQGISKVRTIDELERMRAEWRVQCKTVIWTNGIFDLIHAGHVRSLRDAKSLGDILVVGINSDASARAVKGPGRPLMTQEDRAEVLSALEMVDYVVIFDETEPSVPLSRLRPDIHCKGEEYAEGKRPVPERSIVESYGGVIRFLPLHAGRSTTALLERICAMQENRQ